MNIVVSINANYLRPLCVMLRSLLDSNPGEEVSLYILHSSLTEENLQYIRTLVPDQRCQVTGTAIPEDFLADAPVLFHFPKEMYYRIFSARLLPQSLDRALYLDPDMIVNLPLASLYNMEMGDHYFAAASSINPLTQVEFKHRLDMPDDSEYFNSGVLLMNLKELRATQDLEAPLRYIEENREKLILPDQDVLNALYHDRTILLDPMVYNFDARYYGASRVSSLGKINLDWMRKNTAIIHYCGANKPWNPLYLGEVGIFYKEVAQKMNLEE